MKNETLEEAAKKYAESTPDNDPVRIKSFIEGAKWQAEQNREEIGPQQIELNHTKTLLASCEKALENIDKQAERMYSEEEVLDLLAGFIDGRGGDFVSFKDIQEWFEQFKKK